VTAAPADRGRYLDHHGDSRRPAAVSPVWFVWEEDEFLVYAQPRSWKMRNIRVNPQVSLHLNSDTAGGHVVTFEGSARLAEGTSPGARGCRLFGEVPRGDLGHRLA